LVVGEKLHMNRETMIAICFGIGLGVLVGVVVLFQTNKGEETKVIPITRENDQQKAVDEDVPANASGTNLSVSSPANNSIVSKNSIEIAGVAKKNSLLVIQSASAEKIQKNENEEFKVETPLAVGENVIQISAYSDSSTPQEQTLRIYYIPAE